MTSQSYLLSIIITLYNNDNLIITCLQSLLPQVDNDIEVIIINDGSTDSSEEKVLNYIEGHDNFKLISQENHGVAHAKNTGLQNVQGKYVTFIDSDDLVSRQYINTLRPLLQSAKYDLIDFRYKKFCTQVPEDKPFDAPHHIDYCIESKGIQILTPVFEKSLWHMVTRVYARHLLQGERLENGRRYEDVIFTPFLYFKTRKIAHLDQVLYFYRDNGHGITRNVKAKDIEDMLFAINKMLRYIDQHPGDEALRQLAALMLANCFSEMRGMSKALYGYYHYQPEVLHTLRRLAGVCRSSDVPRKKILQMRYARIDSWLSKIRWRMKKR
ncbi:glycosyltransferase [Serratia quinivorans]|uniref:glycosyltransferase n=1 Tax=Serratia quinivorans TaxID=137545 RepID=UPI0021777B55|nr:glycosyltransferase [Serratia quinivorans]CAI1211643.1 Chondroitin polymerase [Serratia quinivorans]CAI2157601.1 Chondroitin polymerase [Serratia quinivorans]